MEEKKQYKDIKTRFLNLILDNGVSLSITVAFCFALYYILHEHNKLLLEQLYKIIEDKRVLTERLLECYKYQKND
ncbi:MAG: hypothetical protein GY823_01650 [Flavobacteriaceae bacterium]|nr:hypothetical protein [Flavobacteriaceae bacterium]